MGIEKEYVINPHALDEKIMTCPLCQKILVNPVLCGRCNNHFCFSELQEYIKAYLFTYSAETTRLARSTGWK